MVEKDEDDYQNEIFANLVPRAFPLKNGWPHPFFKGKALGTRLDFRNTQPRPQGFSLKKSPIFSREKPWGRGYAILGGARA